MPAETRHYLGVDFGTANSFLAITAEGVLSATPIDFGGDGVRSTVLHRRGDAGIETVVAFGERAEHEWGMATPAEKKSLRLASHFKPDIATDSDLPRKDAVAFLTCMADDLTRRSVLPSGKKPNELAVLVGTPANAMAGYDQALRQIAAEAGFGDVELVPEPIGALVGHLSRHDFSIRDARGGLLVIDFGGGTCDVAYVLRLEVRHAWGDPILGGRLFDDLFFQWFCEANPDAPETLARDGDAYYVHWIKCREMKERFSETLERDRDAAFRYTLQPYGRLSDATWSQFIDRARRYSPSPDFRSQLARFGPVYGRLTSGQPVDLLAWVRQVLVRGLEQGKVRSADISYVILTGGSSAWPFVREMVAEVLDVSPERILSSPNPRRAIGEGIALLPVLKQLHEKAVAEIRSESPSKTYVILRDVQRIAEAFLEDLSGDLSAEFVAQVEPLLAEFRNTGGRLCDLESRIAEQAPALERLAVRLVEERSGELGAKINQRITDSLADWFRSKHVQWAPERLSVSQAGPVSLSGPNVPVDDVCMTGLTAVTSTVMAVALGGLCGGAGTALVLSGPAGWILGAVLGLVLTLVAARQGRPYIEKTTKSIRIPAGVAWVALRKVQYGKLRRDIQDQLLEAFRPELENRQTELRRHIDEITQAQIDEIGALDRL